MLLDCETVGEEKFRVEASPKWVRVMFGGRYIADSRRVILLYAQRPPFPTYYFPIVDVHAEHLTPTDYTKVSDLGIARYWSVKVGDRTAENAAWSYPTYTLNGLNLGEYMAFDWDKMDAWFEEAEEVYAHAHDPHHRIDTLYGSTHVEVVVEGEKVADSHSPVVLFETGLPTRYYLPKTDLRMDLLVPSDSTTRCAYKGTANYYSVKAGAQIVQDVAWYYRFTTTETSKIAGRIAFYNERVDLYLDGVKQERPKSHWS